jgi:hypothetical protein
MDVARFFVYALLGPDHQGSPYTQTGERVRQLALSGVRLIVEELRSDATKTRKDGRRGGLRIDYGDPTKPEAAVKWLWRFVEAAKTPGELYGRALVVIAAEQCATRLVLATSQRGHSTSWGSHKQLAAKALKKLAGPHLPASLTRLEQAIKRAQAAYDEAEHAHYDQQRAARQTDPYGQEPTIDGAGEATADEALGDAE